MSFSISLASRVCTSNFRQSAAVGICVFRIGLYFRMYSPSFCPISSWTVRIIPRVCIIKHIKIDGMAFALRFRQDAVFPLFLAFNGCVVLRHAFQHIHTLADVNNGIVDLDAVNSRMVVFGSKPFSFEPVIDIFFIASLFQNSNSPKGISG